MGFRCVGNKEFHNGRWPICRIRETGGANLMFKIQQKKSTTKKKKNHKPVDRLGDGTLCGIVRD
jgi:hypothetical protein